MQILHIFVESLYRTTQREHPGYIVHAHASEDPESRTSRETKNDNPPALLASIVIYIRALLATRQQEGSCRTAHEV